jgi:hypothetical protein
MNLFPDLFAVSLSLGIKFQFSPASIAMLGALVFCLVIVWKWAKRRLM